MILASGPISRFSWPAGLGGKEGRALTADAKQQFGTDEDGLPHNAG
jgi:hypothetical protein